LAGETWELPYFLAAVFHRILYLCTDCMYERLLREDSSSQELISKFIASNVFGCTIEVRGVCDVQLMTWKVTLSLEPSLARMPLGH
jgi:hypothetical protein